jgi:hypothetical protein
MVETQPERKGLEETQPERKENRRRNKNINEYK